MKVDLCLKCGTPMYRGTVCPQCGAPDRLGRATEVSKGIAGFIFAFLMFVFFAIVTIAAIWALFSG
jgi:hypothetical protein